MCGSGLIFWHKAYLYVGDAGTAMGVWYISHVEMEVLECVVGLVMREIMGTQNGSNTLVESRGKSQLTVLVFLNFSKRLCKCEAFMDPKERVAASWTGKHFVSPVSRPVVERGTILLVFIVRDENFHFRSVFLKFASIYLYLTFKLQAIYQEDPPWSMSGPKDRLISSPITNFTSNNAISGPGRDIFPHSPK